MNAKPETTNLLLSSLKQGNREAFDVIFREHWEFVYLSAYKRLQDEDAAKDIAQELFIALWEKRHDLEIDNLSAWLYSSVRFRVISYLRSAGTDSRYHEQLANLTNSHYIYHAMAEHDAEVVFDHATRELPEKMKQIFEMSRLQQKSVNEIAQELGLSPQTVKNQLTSALKLVSKKLAHISLLYWFFLLT